MAAQSPVAETSPDSRDAYLLSWAAITQMLGRGFSLSGRERNSCFLNLGGGRFADASAVSGFDFLDDGRALGIVDWDFDGRQDVWALNRNGPQLRFLHNRLEGRHHFVSLRLQGVTCNRDAVGARIEVRVGGEKPEVMIRTLRAGEAFLSQSSKWIHFGLGDAPRIEKLTISWPGGGRDVYSDLEGDRQYVITQGAASPEQWSPPAGRVTPQPGEPEPPSISDAARVVMAARPVIPAIIYDDLEGGEHSLDDLSGSPVLVNLWATWCAPCLQELGAFSEDREAIEEAGLKILALNVDELDEGGEDARRAKATATLKGLDYPFLAGAAGPDALSRLDALQLANLGMQIPLSLPTSFLLDSQGLVAVVYKGPVEVDQLLADVAELETAPADRRDRAVPFPGRWLSPPLGTEPIRLALKMVDGGDREAGLRYLERYRERYDEGRLPESDPGHGLMETSLAEVLFTEARLHRQAGMRKEAVAAYEMILQLEPGHRQALLDLGHLYLRSGKPAKAAPFLAKVLEITPRDIDTLSLLATAKLQLGDLAESEELCRRILRQDPDHATSRLNLGLAAEGKKAFGQATFHYREALRILPDWQIAMNQLAWILSTSADPEVREAQEALALATRLEQLNQGREAVYLRTVAAAQAESGQFAEAVATIERALPRVSGRHLALRRTLETMRRQFLKKEPYRAQN